MQITNVGRWLLTAVAMIAQCGCPPQNAVRISEIPLRQHRHRCRRSHRSLRARRHGPHRLARWCSTTATAAPATTPMPLPGTVPATCGARGVVVLNYAVERHPERLARRHRARQRLRHGRRIPLLRRRVRRDQRSGGRPHLHRHRRSQNGNGPRRPVAGAQCRRHLGSGARTPSAPATTTATTPPRRKSRASRSRPRPRPSASARRVTLVATRFRSASAAHHGVPFTWTSTDPAVATVSATGVVTGVAAGDAIILATAANGVAGLRRTACRRGAAARAPTSTSTKSTTTTSAPTRARPSRSKAPRARTSTASGRALQRQRRRGLQHAGADRRAADELRHARRRRRWTIRRTASRTEPRRHRAGEPIGQVLEFLSYEGTFTAASTVPPRD